MNSQILLVSGSPRRRELLDMIGVTYEVLNADIDESRLEGESAPDYVSRLALEKARAGADQQGSRPALGADTIVLLDGEILGKPRDRAEAAVMLRRLSGATHEVLTAVAVLEPGGSAHEVLNRTKVAFGEVPDQWVNDYVQTAEPMDKAGAYAIQGRCGQWVRHIEGSYSGVMGLPVFDTADLLRQAGVEAGPT